MLQSAGSVLHLERGVGGGVIQLRAALRRRRRLRGHGRAGVWSLHIVLPRAVLLLAGFVRLVAGAGRLLVPVSREEVVLRIPARLVHVFPLGRMGAARCHGRRGSHAASRIWRRADWPLPGNMQMFFHFIR